MSLDVFNNVISRLYPMQQLISPADRGKEPKNVKQIQLLTKK